MTGALAEAARETSAVDYVSAADGLREFSRRFVVVPRRLRPAADPDARAAAGADRSASPTPIPGSRCAGRRRFTPFTQVANITGHPAVSVPLSWSEDGLPIGVQLVGGPADEATLLRISAQLERARPWRDRRPPVS